METTNKFAVMAITLLCSSHAFGAEPDAASAPCDLNVRSQPLDTALQEVARQCAVQLLFFSDLAAGRVAPELSGRLAVDDALRTLLADSGLSHRRVNATTIEIRRATERRGATTAQTTDSPRPLPEAPIDEIVIRGTAEGLVATRIETPLRDIPQTISIVSSEQMKLQNSFDLSDALSEAVGFTSIRRNSLLQSFYARGLPVQSYTIDGGGALHSFSELPHGPMLITPDMGEFDHIEVLRGANALFGADGSAGGSINLVRKRPLADFRAEFTTSAGSWNDYRQQADVTGPLALAGALRGRVVASYSDREYFYDNAEEQRTAVFGALELDATERTLLTVGGSVTSSRAKSFESGLPRLNYGGDPRLSRETGYVFDWARFDTKVGEAYLRLDQRFGTGWKLAVNTTLLEQQVDYLYAAFLRPIDEATGGISFDPIARDTVGPSKQRQMNVEATLTHDGEWGGRNVQIALGADFLRADSSDLRAQALYGPRLDDAWNFDPSVYAPPEFDPVLDLDQDRDYRQILTGYFASLRVQATERWLLGAGLRLSNQDVADHATLYFSGFEVPFDFDYEYRDKVTPYFGTTFALNDHYTLYASYADIYLSNLGFTRADGSKISPSDGVNMEVGAKASWRDGKLNATLAVYQIEHTGALTGDPDAVPVEYSCCYLAERRNTSDGVDLEISGEIAGGWIIGGGYTFNQNDKNRTDASVLEPLIDLMPKHLLRVWTNYQLPRAPRWSIGGSLNAQSGIQNWTRGCAVLNAFGFCVSGFQDFLVEQDAYVIVSPRVAFAVNDHVQLALNVDNLFDERYYESLGNINGANWYGEPRAFMLRMDVRL